MSGKEELIGEGLIMLDGIVFSSWTIAFIEPEIWHHAKPAGARVHCGSGGSGRFVDVDFDEAVALWRRALAECRR